jgi:ribosome modulation factor
VSAFDEGVQAFRDDKLRGLCPYSEGDAQRAPWLCGWDHGWEQDVTRTRGSAQSLLQGQPRPPERRIGDAFQSEDHGATSH